MRTRVSADGEQRLDHFARELRASALMCIVNGSRIWLYDFNAGFYRLNFEGRLPSLRTAA